MRKKRSSRLKFISVKRKLIVDKLRREVIKCANEQVEKEIKFQNKIQTKRKPKRKVVFDEDSKEIHEY